MAQTSDVQDIHPTGDPISFARAHPSFFFASGVSEKALTEQLVAGARALGAQHVQVLRVEGWSVVASPQDWFAGARFPVPEDLRFRSLSPFPELGQNCTRPEFLVAAFARTIIIRGPSGVRVVKGEVSAGDRIVPYLAGASAWQRAIAFRDIDA
jgi:hypothetical protein